MKKKCLYVILFITFIVTCIAVIHTVFDRPQLQLSPSGIFYLETEINQSKVDIRKYLCIKLIVKDTQGNIVQEIQTGASKKMAWDVVWKDNDLIFLDSSDIGIWEWKKQKDNKWLLVSCP